MNFDGLADGTLSSVSRAVRDNNVELLRQLLKEDKPVDIQDNTGCMPIHHAAALGHLECLEALIDHDKGKDVFCYMIVLGTVGILMFQMATP